MFADFISPDDCCWARVLERVPHDVYHLPQYAVVTAKHEGGKPVAFYARAGQKEILIPLLLKALPAQLEASGEWKDATSPYGYPGPVTTHPHDSRWLEESLSALQNLGSGHGIVTAFLRLHPLRGVTADTFAGHGIVVHHGPIVYVDLTRTLDELQAGTRLNHKRNIRRLAQAGFMTSVDDWSIYPAFGSLYRATMERVRAADFYFFSDAYFEDLRRMLKERLHFFAVVAPGGQLAAAGLFTETDGIVEYHLGGTATAYLRQAPSKLMFDAVIRWGKSIGAEVLNLGGGMGGRAGSLFEFKAGFSHSRAQFHTVRMILDEPLYADLAHGWRARGGNVQAVETFFPIYRMDL